MKLIAKSFSLAGAGLLTLPVAAMAAEGMPQLDFANPLTTSQVVWGAIIFVVLYILLSRGGIPRVASVLEERAAKISADLDAARAAKAKADAGAEQSRVAHEQARAEAQGAINAAVGEAKDAAAKQAEALNARLDKQLHDAEAQIAQARASAMSAVRQVSTETASMVVARLSGTAPKAATLDKAIASAMTARGIG
ncbi:MAG TPA: hypothetical protein VFG62_19335 [Rhodopila sp.]|nr:hypothetical protein [Rhodopila sp.]